MLTPGRIEMLVDRGAHDRLIEEVLANGRPLPLSARLRLSDPGWAETVALGLASRRIGEFAGGLSRAAEGPARRLAELQNPDGSFGHVVPTAAAIAGLRPIVSEAATLRADRPFNTDLTTHLADTLDRAEHALHWAVENARIAESARTGGVSPLDAALACWLLADTPAGLGSAGAAGFAALLPSGFDNDSADWARVFNAATAGLYTRAAA